jgi:hypothetical protein
MTRVLASALATLLCSCSSAVAAPPGAAPVYGSEFWAHWGDGQAELSGYALERTRYGEKRTGSLVSIFVTEPFSKADHVKSEKARPAGDVMQVLKHNLVEKFQTGVYDYQVFTTTFVGLESAPGRPLGRTAKISSSTQEWCGTTYHDVTFDARGGTEVLRSYFDGESKTAPLPSVPALAEDAAWHWARGLAAPVVAPGAQVDADLLPALAAARLAHQPLTLARATLSRAADTESVDVPAGRFTVRRATLAGINGVTTTFFVEEAAPRRVVRLERSDGLTAVMTGSIRSAYWQKNHEGDEGLLGSLGLVPPRARVGTP